MPVPGVGDGDFSELVAIPHAVIRSRHVDTEEVEEADVLDGPPEGLVQCPACSVLLPSMAVRCPHDGTDLTSA